MLVKAFLIAILLIGNEPSAVRHHFGRVLVMGKLVLGFDDKKLLFSAGMSAGDFFDKLERRMTTEGERFRLDSGPVSTYPATVKVNLFANDLTLDQPAEKRCAGVARVVMNSLEIKAEWKTKLTTRPVSGMVVRHMQTNELVPNALAGYEVSIPSEGVLLTDHLIVTVYGPDSSLIARFSGAP